MERILTDLVRNSEGLIFDFDGVIADTEKLHAQSYSQVLKEFDIDFNPMSFSKYVGTSDTAIFSKMRQLYSISFEMDAIRKKRNETFLKLVVECNLQPNSDIRKIIIKEIHKPKVILSSQSRNIINILLSRWSLSEHFSEIYAAEDLNIEKEEALLKLEDFLGLKFEKMVIFEDSNRILSIAKQLGMNTVGVLHLMNESSGIAADVII